MIRDYIHGGLIGISILLIPYAALSKMLSRRRKVILSGMSFIAIGLLVAGAFAKKFDGSFAGRASKYLVYALLLLIILVFNQYVKDLFKIDGKESSEPKRLIHVDAVIIMGQIMLFISRFVGLYYTFDENGMYHRAKGFWVSYVFPIGALLILLSVIVQFRKNFRKRIALPLLLFTALPLVAAGMQYFMGGVSFSTTTIVAMTVLLYGFSIMDANEKIAEAHKNEVLLLKEKQEMTDQIVSSLVTAIDAKDEYTNGHSRRVAEYSADIADKAGKTEEECNEIYLMALLHDVGKIGVPGYIINKAGKLTEEEFDKIKQHPIIGRRILERISSSPRLVVGASYHHERYDGKGYPYGLQGEEIPEEARIIAVADSYDAMSSKRSYRDALPQETVRQEIEKGRGTQFDPKFAQIMLEIIDADKDYNLRQKD